MAKSAGPNETAHYEPSHLDQQCLHMILCWTVGLKGLNRFHLRKIFTLGSNTMYVKHIWLFNNCCIRIECKKTLMSYASSESRN